MVAFRPIALELNIHFFFFLHFMAVGCAVWESVQEEYMLAFEWEGIC